MKKFMIMAATLMVTLFSVTSCSEEDKKNFEITGYWKCTGMSGSAFSQSANLGQDYTKYFSISFAGATSGVYARVGATAEGIEGLKDLGSSDSKVKDLQKTFLSAGNYVISDNKITLTPTGGKQPETYDFVMGDGQMTLTQTLDINTSEIIGGTASNVVNALGAIFGTGALNDAVGAKIVYSYQKVSVQDIINLFKKE